MYPSLDAGVGDPGVGATRGAAGAAGGAIMKGSPRRKRGYPTVVFQVCVCKNKPRVFGIDSKLWGTSGGITCCGSVNKWKDARAPPRFPKAIASEDLWFRH